MSYTEAKKECNARYAAKLDTIKLRPYKDEGAIIRQAAKNSGQSMQAYILEAVRAKMARDLAVNSQPPEDAPK